MKVSITFDKNLKQSNKKEWVREIQNVVDKLNTKSQAQSTIKATTQSNCYYHSASQHSSKKQKIKEDTYLIQGLLSIQRTMEEKFSKLSFSIHQISDKLNHVQKRLSILQTKEVNRAALDQDFDSQFAQLSLKYQRVKKQFNSSSQSFKKAMAQTTESQFSNYTRYLHDND